MRRSLALLFLVACGAPAVSPGDGGSAGGGAAGGSSVGGGSAGGEAGGAAGGVAGGGAGGSAGGVAGGAAGGAAGGTAGGAAGGVAGGSAGGAAGGSAGGAAFPAPAPEGCVQNVTAGTRDYTCDGLRYRATIPASCLTQACGLIFDVHGFTMSAEMEEANTKLAMRASARNFIVVQPSANPAPPLASWTPGTDDDKVFAVVELFARVFHANPKKLHFTGFSQGGNMTWRMLCKHADVWGSVAPGAGTGCAFSATEKPSREVPTLFLVGTTDALIPYSTLTAPQRNSVVSGWNMGMGTVIASDTTYRRTRWTSAAGTQFEVLEHDYNASVCVLQPLGGHCFPGSNDPGNAMGQLCSFKCNGTTSFDWGAEILTFFEAHPKP